MTSNPNPTLNKLYEEVETLITEVGEKNLPMGNVLQNIVDLIHGAPQETPEQEDTIEAILKSYVAQVAELKAAAEGP